MNKRHFYLLLILLSFHQYCLEAQNFNYTLTKDSSVYQALSSPIVLASATDWSLQTFGVKLPFAFNFCGSTTDSIIIENNGAIVSDTKKNLAIVAFNGFGCRKDSLQQYVSTISTQTTGTTGNRIFKIEFNNLAQTQISSLDYLNYQVWLYENGTIEFHMGENAYAHLKTELRIDPSNPLSAMQMPTLIGLVNRNMDTPDKALVITGNPSSPHTEIITSEFMYLHNVPYSGVIYKLVAN